MASCEYIPYLASCPCGRGSLHRQLESPNYPFGVARFGDIRFDCPHCRSLWSPTRAGDRLLHVARDLCPANKPLQLASMMRLRLARELDSLKAQALHEQLQAAGAKSKAAEHRHLVGRGLFRGSYGAYLRGGREAAASALDASTIPACAPVLALLAEMEGLIDSLRDYARLWLDERREELEFPLAWRH